MRVLCAFILTFFSSIAHAQTYPNKPIRWVVPYTGGGITDIVTRVVTQKMQAAPGQAIVVDNKPGANSIIGADLVAKAQPDGYNIVTVIAAHAANATLYQGKLPFDPVKSFIPFSLAAIAPLILTANNNFPARDVKDLIAYAKANPGKLNMSNAGAGFQSHLAGVLFTHATGIDVHQVPYKGGASLIAVIGNESQFTIAPGPSVISHVRSGRLRALATGGEKRSPQTPDLPTIGEAGVPGYVSTGWAGIMAPKGVAQPIFDKLYATLVKVVNNPATRELLERQGGDPVTNTPAEFVSFIKEEYARFGEAIRLANLKVE